MGAAHYSGAAMCIAKKCALRYRRNPRKRRNPRNARNAIHVNSELILRGLRCYVDCGGNAMYEVHIALAQTERFYATPFNGLKYIPVFS